MSAQRGVRLPLSDAVLEPNFRETLAPGKTRFCRINFRLQRLNGFSQRPSEKIPMQLIPDAMSFPMRVTPNCPEGLRRFFNWNQFQSLNFLQKKTAFICQNSEVCYKFPIPANFQRSNFRAIVKDSYGEKFSWSVDFSRRYRQFSVSAIILNYLQTALNDVMFSGDARRTAKHGYKTNFVIFAGSISYYIPIHYISVTPSCGVIQTDVKL